jgi:branched-chain amino acid transport system substrate-binding protein
MTQARQLGLSMPFFASSGVLQGAFLDLAGKAAEDLYVVTYFNLDNPAPRVQAFIKEYREKFKMDPTPVSGLAYDGTNLFVNALKKVGTDKKRIMKAMRTTKGYIGVTGLMECDDVGQAGRSAIITQIRNKKPVVVWSSEK